MKIRFRKYSCHGSFVSLGFVQSIHGHEADRRRDFFFSSRGKNSRQKGAFLAIAVFLALYYTARKALELFQVVPHFLSLSCEFKPRSPSCPFPLQKMCLVAFCEDQSPSPTRTACNFLSLMISRQEDARKQFSKAEFVCEMCGVCVLVV